MQQYGTLRCDFYPVSAHIAPSTVVTIEAINLYKQITTNILVKAINGH